MRFRRIEKDVGGMANVGLKDQHIQGKEDDVTTSYSKTYIGSRTNKKPDMNKIKNTKIGDDIHYYINGVEGRGIVVKMANEYLEVFKENGQLGTIHINDTFFVKDILVNKQWNDMDECERYDALAKIHAPTPRFLTKAWEELPSEITSLLRKEGGNMAGGTGSTYEKGESKESETKDHARTGFAQNTQYKDAAEKDDDNYGGEKGKYNSRGERVETRAGQEKKILGHYTVASGTKGGRWAAEQEKKRNEEMVAAKAKEKEKKEKEEKNKPAKTAKELQQERDLNKPDPKNPKFTLGGKRIPKYMRKSELEAVLSGEYLVYKKAPTGTGADEPGNKPSKRKLDAEKEMYGMPDPSLEQHTREGQSEEAIYGYFEDKDDLDELTSGGKKTGKKDIVESHPNKKGTKQSTKAELEAVLSGEYNVYKAETLQKDAEDGRQSPDRKPLQNPDACHICGKEGGHGHGDFSHRELTSGGKRTGRRGISIDGGKFHPDEPEDKSPSPSKKAEAFRKLKPVYEGDTKEAEKSDVEHGKYSNPGGTPEVGVSTDTKVDVTTGTGYEERPHISVEEAGKLPRGKYSPHGSNELSVSGSQDSKDEPKFSQPHSQEQVRKVGVPQQHPNTYGMRYGMKGGVKKVWCPEHQMWEETRKDWHE